MRSLYTVQIMLEQGVRLFVCLMSHGCRVGGPAVWNTLPVELREPAVSNGVFRRTLKTILFA